MELRLFMEQGGLCARCGEKPDWRGLVKHEKKFRSHGGSPTDKDNCELLCGKCHSMAHLIRER
ncbi:MAG: HNH endonuclease signature motif containing protein [Candidatus Izemoplasmatales bacterium]